MKRYLRTLVLGIGSDTRKRRDQPTPVRTRSRQMGRSAHSSRRRTKSEVGLPQPAARFPGGLLLWGALVCALLACGRTENDNAGASDARASFDAARKAPILQQSMSGAYRVALQLEDPEATRDRLHAWRVRIERSDGVPLAPTRLAFSGGMPQHGHGFQTAPRVTGKLSEGWWRIQGVRFHMAGAWTLRVEFASTEGADVAIVELDVPY